MTRDFAKWLKRIEVKRQTVNPKRTGGYFAALLLTLSTMMFCSLPASAQITDSNGDTFNVSAQGQVQECYLLCTNLTGTNTVVSQLVATGNGTPGVTLYILANNGGPNQVWQYAGTPFNWTPITGTNTTVYSISASGNILSMNATNGGPPQTWVYSGSGTDWFPEGQCAPHAVYGLIGARYLALGGAGGPLGCPLSDEADTPNGQGRFNDFQYGEIVYSPAQTGPSNVVSAYWQQVNGYPDANYSLITVQWGDMSPYHYDKFLLWPNASNPNNAIPPQYDLDISGSSGSYSFANVCGSTYSIGVKGCDHGDLWNGWKDKCNEDWSTPVNISVPTPYNYGINEGCY